MATHAAWPTIITLGVRDLQQSVEFYLKLGLIRKEFGNPDNIAFFQSPGSGTMLSLYPLEKLAEDARAAGAALAKPAEKAFWGGYSGYFRDPDGHYWEVAHNPYL